MQRVKNSIILTDKQAGELFKTGELTFNLALVVDRCYYIKERFAKISAGTMGVYDYGYPSTGHRSAIYEPSNSYRSPIKKAREMPLEAARMVVQCLSVSNNESHIKVIAGSIQTLSWLKKEGVDVNAFESDFNTGFIYLKTDESHQ